jgi:hypothetical protein
MGEFDFDGWKYTLVKVASFVTFVRMLFKVVASDIDPGKRPPRRRVEYGSR